MALSAGPGMLAPAPASAGPQPIPSSNRAADNRSDLLQCNSSCCVSHSPRQFPVDLPDPILEEGDESSSEGPLEPVTPVSGRQSQDFTTLRQGQDHDQDQDQDDHSSATPSKAALLSAQRADSSLDTNPRLIPSSISTSAAGQRPLSTVSTTSQLTSAISNTSVEDTPTTPKAGAENLPQISRRSTRGSTSSFKRTMSSFFRRSNSTLEKHVPAFESGSPSASESYLNRPPTQNNRPPTSSAHLSSTKSSNTTRSSSPPSPGSPLEMAPVHKAGGRGEELPSPADFKKKNRASTGLSLRGRAVNFVGATVGRQAAPRPKAPPRRANSFDAGNRSLPANQHKGPNEQTFPPERLPWAMPPDAGTGAKARRMSLSLPDDFNVDVAELQNEFEYQSKLLGRHGKHLGKGAASKVTLMVRKGYPNELYAVKEFRGKSGRESKEDYDKKIKSEFSIGKSLHHPNIVETIRLCSDHGRWNHVMEYCSEGDLFSLVQKGWLKGDGKLKDRLCLFKQLIQGVNYLHANGIAHRDIKLENLLITKDSKIKITDFGVSEVFCGTHPGLRESGGQCGKNMGEIRLCSPGICGSEPYIAPEVLQKKGQYDPRALDVWSTAIVMIYMTFGGAIWSRAERGNLHYDKLVAGWEKWNKKHESDESPCITETDYPNCYALDVGMNPPALRRVLLQMLHPDPNERISVNEVISNRWVKNIECCQLESYDDPTHTIDVTKKDYAGKGAKNKKIFCHSHLPPKTHGSHSLGKMPGQAGY